jgi:hypothetical protein
MRKRTKRKVWRTDNNPIEIAIAGAAITADDKLQQLQRRELASIDAFARGEARETDWHDINAMKKICRIMAEDGVGPEALAACDIADEHLKADMALFEKTGKMTTSYEGLKAYRDVYEYMHLQRTSIARSQYEGYVRKLVAITKAQMR